MLGRPGHCSASPVPSSSACSLLLNIPPPSRNSSEAPPSPVQATGVKTHCYMLLFVYFDRVRSQNKHMMGFLLNAWVVELKIWSRIVVERCKAPPSAPPAACRRPLCSQQSALAQSAPCSCTHSTRAHKNLAKIYFESQLQQKDRTLLISSLCTCNKYDACPMWFIQQQQQQCGSLREDGGLSRVPRLPKATKCRPLPRPPPFRSNLPLYRGRSSHLSSSEFLFTLTFFPASRRRRRWWWWRLERGRRWERRRTQQGELPWSRARVRRGGEGGGVQQQQQPGAGLPGRVHHHQPAPQLLQCRHRHVRQLPGLTPYHISSSLSCHHLLWNQRGLSQICCWPPHHASFTWDDGIVAASPRLWISSSNDSAPTLTISGTWIFL